MSTPKSARLGGASALLLAEEALQLLHRVGLASLSLYVIATVPFLLGLTAFVGTMAHSGFAQNYVGTGALGMALLFMWMKTLQNRFAQHLSATLHDEPLPGWTLGTMLTTFCRQSMLHASAVLVYPIAILMVLPIGFTLAFYQNLSVLDNGSTTSTSALIKDALQQSRRWSRQNHMLHWLCSPLLICVAASVFMGVFPVLEGMDEDFLVTLGYVYASILLLIALPFAPFAVATAVNLGSSLFLLVEIYHILTGADTLFARSSGAVMENDLIYAIIGGGTYLLLDPILKAAFAIRCYEGKSLESGIDLRVLLRRIRAGGVSVLILGTTLFALPVAAENPAEEIQVSPFDQAIDHELAERRYTWRMPRVAEPAVEMPWLLQRVVSFGDTVRGWLESTITYIKDTVEAIWDWLFGDNEKKSPQGMGDSAATFDKSIRILIGVLAAILMVVTLYLLWSMFKNRRAVPLVPVAALTKDLPDIRDEAATAADRPEDEWTRLARELAGQGEFRLAARALFFSILATLAREEIIRIAQFKSNRDYSYELKRRAAAIGEIPQRFSEGAFVYESVWYGEHVATTETLDALYACQEAVVNGL